MRSMGLGRQVRVGSKEVPTRVASRLKVPTYLHATKCLLRIFSQGVAPLRGRFQCHIGGVGGPTDRITVQPLGLPNT